MQCFQHHNGHSFDVLDRFQENKVLLTAKIVNNRDLLNQKFRKIPVWLFDHSNYVVKTEFFKKEQSCVNISYLLQQHTKLFLKSILI